MHSWLPLAVRARLQRHKNEFKTLGQHPDLDFLKLIVRLTPQRVKLEEVEDKDEDAGHHHY